MRGLTGERRAIAAAVLAFYTFLHLIAAFVVPPAWEACYWALTIVYGLGFFALVAGYFWARWYAIGLGLYGAVVGVIGLVYLGYEPVLVFYGGTHLVISAALFGHGMGALFDGRVDWRDRFHLDEDGAHRLGRAVTRLGLSLPFMITYALAPREDGSGLALLGGALAIGGFYALLKNRSWGVLALGGSAAAVLASALTAPSVYVSNGWSLDLMLLGVSVAVLVAAAVAPFAVPVAQYLATNEE